MNNTQIIGRRAVLLALALLAAAGAAGWSLPDAQAQTVTVAPPIISDLDAFVLYTNEPAALADRASATGNVGANATLELGADGRVFGSIQTRSGVSLRVRSRVEGNVTSGGSVVRQADAVVTGVVTQNASVPNLPLPTQTVIPGTTNVMVYGGQSRVLAPGAYGEVHVFSGANLTLGAGTYSVRRFVIEANPASLKVDTSAGDITLLVNEHLSFGDGTKMTFVGTGQVSQILIYSNQSSQLYMGVDAVILGKLTAPFAEARLASRATLRGFAHARRAVVDPDGKLLTQ